MFQTMTQIAKEHQLEAKDVGNILYALKIRDANHPTQKGFPFEQAITHGIALATTSRSGETYYKYDISSIKEEFKEKVAALQQVKKKPKPKSNNETPTFAKEHIKLDQKLKSMLNTINEVLATGETEKLYRLKADIADIYALSERETPSS